MSETSLTNAQKRVAALFCVLILGFSLVFLRIFLVATGEDLQAVAKAQSSYTLTVDESRGMIYDCNFEPLVNETEGYRLSVLPCDEAAAALTRSLDMDARTKLMPLFESGKPFVQRFDSPYIYAQGITVFTVKERYAKDQLAAHVVGHLDGDGQGAYGIERAYNELLTKNSGSLGVTYTVDALRRPLVNVPPEVKRNNYANKQGVVLTIDSEMQKIAEEEGGKLISKGAVVVMEAATGKLRAVASFPDFTPTNIAASLDNPDSPLINRCFAAYNVGSTFKLSGVAAALEAGISTDYKYTCEGSINIDGLNFFCHNRAGHGELDLWGALEHSCNPYFINLARETGYDNVYEMAVMLGFGKSDILCDGLKTAEGTLPTMASLQNNAVLANFAFGQGELTATPVQIAKMISVFANGGYMVYPSLVEGISDKQGAMVETPFEASESYRLLPEDTARTVRQLMVSVVEQGSGTNARPAKGGAGGKTGSAQTGVYNEDKQEIVHAWFSGFFPAEDPRYVIVVLNEGKDSGGDYSAPVFREIADRITNLEVRRAEAQGIALAGAVRDASPDTAPKPD